MHSPSALSLALLCPSLNGRKDFPLMKLLVKFLRPYFCVCFKGHVTMKRVRRREELTCSSSSFFLRFGIQQSFVIMGSFVKKEVRSSFILPWFFISFHSTLLFLCFISTFISFLTIFSFFPLAIPFILLQFCAPLSALFFAVFPCEFSFVIGSHFSCSPLIYLSTHCFSYLVTKLHSSHLSYYYLPFLFPFFIFLHSFSFHLFSFAFCPLRVISFLFVLLSCFDSRASFLVGFSP